MQCAIKDFIKIALSSKQNKMNIASSTNVLVKVKHINLVTFINKVVIFKLLANVDRFPAADESSLNIIWWSVTSMITEYRYKTTCKVSTITVNVKQGVNKDN